MHSTLGCKEASWRKARPSERNREKYSGKMDLLVLSRDKVSVDKYLSVSWPFIKGFLKAKIENIEYVVIYNSAIL